MHKNEIKMFLFSFSDGSVDGFDSEDQFLDGIPIIIPFWFREAAILVRADFCGWKIVRNDRISAGDLSVDSHGERRETTAQYSRTRSKLVYMQEAALTKAWF